MICELCHVDLMGMMWGEVLMGSEGCLLIQKKLFEDVLKGFQWKIFMNI